MVAFIFQVKTEPNQAIKQARLCKKLYGRPLLLFLQTKEV